MRKKLTAKQKLNQAKKKAREVIGKKLDMHDMRLLELFYDILGERLDTWTPVLIKKTKERLIVPVAMLDFTSEDYVFACGSMSLLGWVPADPIYNGDSATTFKLHSLDHLYMPDEVYNRMVELLGTVKFYTAESNGDTYDFALYDSVKGKHIPCNGCKERFPYDNNEILHASMLVDGDIDWHMHFCQPCYKAHVGEIRVFTPVGLDA